MSCKHCFGKEVCYIQEIEQKKLCPCYKCIVQVICRDNCYNYEIFMADARQLIKDHWITYFGDFDGNLLLRKFLCHESLLVEEKDDD